MKQKISILFLSFFLFVTNIYTQETIDKIYIFYSPSHKKLRDKWFLPSLQDDYQVIEEFYPQDGDGNFMNKQWLKMMNHKVDLIIRGILENWGGIFVHSDVDIQFFRPTKELLLQEIKDYDLVIQKDNPQGILCCGFFACRGNEKTLKLWQAVKMYIKEHNVHDQKALNALLKGDNPFEIKWKYLPNIFMSGGTYSGKPWNPGKELFIPHDIVLHHANWTIGVPNKIKQLKYVKNKVQKRKQSQHQ